MSKAKEERYNLLFGHQDVLIDDNFKYKYSETIYKIKELEEKTEWISVEERLPEENGLYLVCIQDEYPYSIEVHQYNKGFMTKENWNHKTHWYRNITHWMPLLEKPKGGLK